MSLPPSARIQQLEAENKLLRAAIGENDDDNDVKRQKIADLEREIQRHRQILDRLVHELAALKTGRYADKSVETLERESAERWQVQHDKKLKSNRFAYLLD